MSRGLNLNLNGRILEVSIRILRHLRPFRQRRIVFVARSRRPSRLNHSPAPFASPVVSIVFEIVRCRIDAESDHDEFSGEESNRVCWLETNRRGQCLRDQIEWGRVKATDGVSNFTPILGHMEWFVLQMLILEPLTWWKELRENSSGYWPLENYVMHSLLHFRSSGLIPMRRSRSRTMRPAIGMGFTPPVSEADILGAFLGKNG